MTSYKVFKKNDFLRSCRYLPKANVTEKSQNYEHFFCCLSQQLISEAATEMFCKKGVLRNFAKFTGKQLCQRLFFNKVAGLRSIIFF